MIDERDLMSNLSPCCAILKAGSGDDRPCSSRSWKAVSCSRLSFFSSLLDCCTRLFLTALLRWSSSQSLRAASYIFIWSANSASTKLSSDSCISYGREMRDGQQCDSWNIACPWGFTYCLKMTLLSLAVSKCCSYLCSLRDALLVQFKRSSNTSANLRRLLSRQ